MRSDLIYLFIFFSTQVRGQVQQQLNLPLQHFTHHHFIKTDGFFMGGWGDASKSVQQTRQTENKCQHHVHFLSTSQAVV